MATRILLVAAIVAACAHSLAIAQEVATDAERTYGELRSAKDARTRLLGERWNNLIRLQEWNDATGNFATTAKYVEHDPELQWVKLRMIKGTGANRVVKDVTIPVAKLSKTCQSRVRQISVLSDKVVAAVAQVQAADEADESGREGELADDARSEFRGEDETSVSDVERSRPRGRDRRRGAPQTDAPPTAAADPLPPRLPPLPTSAANSTSGDPTATAQQGESEASGLPPLDPEHPFMPDNDPWRTSYEAFRGAFERDESDGVIRTVERWAGIYNLQLGIPREYLSGSPPDATTYIEVPKLAEIGDFVWEGTVTEPPTPDANWAEVLGMTTLPEPLKLEFRLGNKGATRAWKILDVGDKVRFIGRFKGYRGQYTWVAEITAAGASFVGDSTTPNLAKEKPPHQSNGGVPPAVTPDNAPWRTDYEAFRANFSLDTSQRMPRTNWGELTALQDACETVVKWESTGSIEDEAQNEIDAKFAAVGEFEWEATLADSDTSAGDWTDRLNLPPLLDADIVAIAFHLDEECPPGDWQALKTGDRIRFIGRFVDFESETDIVVAIRFPDNAVIAGSTGDTQH